MTSGDHLPALAASRYRQQESVVLAVRRRGHPPRVVRYICSPPERVDGHVALSRWAAGRGWLVDPQTYTDRCEPGPVGERTELRIALDRVMAGHADGLLAPAFEHISPDLGEYGDQLHQVRAHDRFIALVLPEIPRGAPQGMHGWKAPQEVFGTEPRSAGAR
ncbi:hypothetical protein ACIQU4_28065 [Streptomyces sp. NPDC090741]|uniref:hypothetical protein n=1 Tax=Streptomyces sp. NPDC090741 TaxID=3365967 RepID=UPI00381F41A3